MSSRVGWIPMRSWVLVHCRRVNDNGGLKGQEGEGGSESILHKACRLLALAFGFSEMYSVAWEVLLNRTRMAASRLALGRSDLEYVQAHPKTCLHHVYLVHKSEKNILNPLSKLRPGFSLCERELSTDLT
jgi:hypothetical protein